MIRTLALASLLSCAAPALAQDVGKVTHPDVVYELFTSQGCSSCPPANKQVAALSTEPDALALSYGVTYWDYLGWKDTFAKPEFTARQHAYVKAMGARNAYTPQIVVNGESHSSRLRKAAVSRSLEAAVDLAESDGILTAQSSDSSGGEVLLVTYLPGTHSVNVERGENGGRTLKLANVVKDVQAVRLPHSFATVSGEAYAVIAHNADLSVTSAAVWTSN